MVGGYMDGADEGGNSESFVGTPGREEDVEGRREMQMQQRRSSFDRV